MALESFLDRFRKQPLPVGFVKGDKRDTYRVDPIYIEADRTFQEMPVKPDYGIVTGVELLGTPQILTSEEVAANPRNTKLPSLTQLVDDAYYRQHVLPGLRSHAGSDTTEAVTGPIETRPFADNIFVFPVVKVQHVQAVQAVGAGGYELHPRAVRDGELRLDEVVDGLKGLAFVTHVRVPLDLRAFFPTPVDLNRTNGKLSLEDKNGRTILQDVFKKKLEDIGDKVSEARKRPVKGVLLSPITVNWRLADSLTAIRTNPDGELMIAASYLV